METVESLAKSVSAKMGVDEEDTVWIELAAREAVVNAIKHGNHYIADKQVDVQLLIGQATALSRPGVFARRCYLCLAGASLAPARHNFPSPTLHPVIASPKLHCNFTACS